MEIPNDTLYVLVRTLKEIYKNHPRETTRDFMTLYRIKAQYEILDKILLKNGINEILDNLKAKHGRMITKQEIKKEILLEDEKNGRREEV